MRFAEIDLFGVYVAPISLMMVGAWLVTIALRRLASRSGLLQYVTLGDLSTSAQASGGLAFNAKRGAGLQGDLTARGDDPPPRPPQPPIWGIWPTGISPHFGHETSRTGLIDGPQRAGSN
jgi:hypothetical protein